ncbi:MAG TPA: molybdopterin cofactor-binding domain-containing protein [Blastocatellia bacterium]|nr:molybdopterin cofactor-binding domain-containing protein [Blastocatellia bacterium]
MSVPAAVPQLVLTVAAMTTDFKNVGKKQPRVDAVKLAVGRGTFVDDFSMPGTLHAKILHSPHAHAIIKKIDTSKAESLPGVRCVLTHENVPHIRYTTAGQGWPEPSPYDAVMFDTKVRFVGDRVAAVAAETIEIAERALQLIDVQYELLPAIFDPEQSMREGAPVIHDEADIKGAFSPARNIAAHTEADLGDIEVGYKQADVVLDQEYRVPYQQQASIEPHIAITWLDEDNRLQVRTSTQVPFHVRRIIAPLLGIPIKRIRVTKPRIGGGFGGKQEILIEDLCGMMTLRTGRPVRLEFTREEELTAARARHPQIVRFKTGVTKDGTLTSMKMSILENTGAYGTHALTVMSVTGSRALSLYKCPNVRFEATAVYTNLLVAGAFRGYGAPQGFFALESHMDELADAIGMDPIEFRLLNMIKEGEEPPMSEVLGEGGHGYPQIIRTCGIGECIDKGKAAIGWDEKRRTGKAGARDEGHVRRGVGMIICMQASGIPGIDMGASSIKMNEDGSFNLLTGATDLGTGADTVLAQIAAETLSVDTNQIIIHSADTDMTPFDTGAYASSTTYISGGAVQRAAEDVRQQILRVASKLLEVDASELTTENSRVIAPSGESISYAEICLSTLYQREQFQIMAMASHMSYESPPPFAAVFSEVEVDTETGLMRVVKLVEAIDCGVAINPQMAEGQIEGAATQSLGYATSESMPFDENGRMLHTSFRDYNIYTAVDMPELEGILVRTYEPTGPFGAKAVAEIPINGPAPAIANAIYNAIGIRIRDLPFTPEKIWRRLNEKNQI